MVSEAAALLEEGFFARGHTTGLFGTFRNVEGKIDIDKPRLDNSFLALSVVEREAPQGLTSEDGSETAMRQQGRLYDGKIEINSNSDSAIPGVIPDPLQLPAKPRWYGRCLATNR